MIIHFSPGGRLGNQLFEIAYIEAIRKPREIIAVTMLSEAKASLCGLRRYINFDGWILTNLVDHVVRPILDRLAVRYKLLGAVIETRDGVIKQEGLFPIRYVVGYFQSERLFPSKSWCPIKIKPAFFISAKRVLARKNGHRPIFVHVRRGDYVSWGDRDPNPSLPEEYYHEAIKRIEESVENPYFFFVGDDPGWCERTFENIRNKYVSRASAPEDLALMSLCEGGICSNSTFAWWGAYMSRRAAPLIGPKYWMRWRIEVWYPHGIMSELFQYLDVKESIEQWKGSTQILHDHARK